MEEKSRKVTIRTAAHHAQKKDERFRAVKFVLNLVLVILALLYVCFVIADRYGVWDHLSGLDSIEGVTARFEQSYAPNASNPLRPTDTEWKPFLKIVYRYSHSDFPKDKQPRVIARFSAVSSARIPAEGPIISEWTAPSTPLAILYKEWPGNVIPQEDFRVIGTIGDLRDWIAKERDRRRFLVQDIFLGIFTPLLSLIVLLIDRRAECV